MNINQMIHELRKYGMLIEEIEDAHKDLTEKMQKRPLTPAEDAQYRLLNHLLMIYKK